MESNSRNSRHCVPPGFRFHPTDEELVNIYLKNKVSMDNNQPHLNNFHLDHVIPEIDLNKLEPWDLREKCNIDANSQCIQAPEWYFFSHKDKKYPTGTRTNRATVAGFWKATGRDKAVHSAPDVRLNVSRMIGMRKTLVFYRGRAPHGKKTDWIMHEYRLEDDNDHYNAIASKSCNEGGWVVCRVFKKRNLPVSSKATTTTTTITHEDSKAMKSSNSDNVIDTNTNALSDAGETPLRRRPKKLLRNVRHSREVGVKSNQDADIISSENFPERIKSETTMSDENTLSSYPLIISTGPSIFDDGFQLPSLICSNDNNDDDDDEGSDDIEQCDNLNKINGSDNNNNNNNNNRKSINHYDNAFGSDHDNLLELIHNGQHINVDSLECGTLTTWSSLYNETSVIATRSNVDNINYRLCPDQFCNLPIDNLLIHHPPPSLNPLHENSTLSFHKHIMMHDQHNPHDHHDSPYNRQDHYNNIMNPSLYNTSCDQLVDLWSFTI